jgi:hypothetical protein
LITIRGFNSVAEFARIQFRRYRSPRMEFWRIPLLDSSRNFGRGAISAQARSATALPLISVESTRLP